MITIMSVISSGFAIDREYGLNVVSTPVNPNATKEKKELIGQNF